MLLPRSISCYTNNHSSFTSYSRIYLSSTHCGLKITTLMRVASPISASSSPHSTPGVCVTHRIRRGSRWTRWWAAGGSTWPAHQTRPCRSRGTPSWQWCGGSRPVAYQTRGDRSVSAGRALGDGSWEGVQPNGAALRTITSVGSSFACTGPSAGAGTATRARGSLLMYSCRPGRFLVEPGTSNASVLLQRTPGTGRGCEQHTIAEPRRTKGTSEAPDLALLNFVLIYVAIGTQGNNRHADEVISYGGQHCL